jgi:hypothetical protein
MSQYDGSSSGENDSEMDYEADGMAVANHLLDIRSARNSSWEKAPNEGEFHRRIHGEHFINHLTVIHRF